MISDQLNDYYSALEGSSNRKLQNEVMDQRIDIMNIFLSKNAAVYCCSNKDEYV